MPTNIKDESLEHAALMRYYDEKYKGSNLYSKTFVDGAQFGANWQKQKDNIVIYKLREALEKAGTLLDFVINATETGTNRNHLTDANIYIKSALASVQKENT